MSDKDSDHESGYSDSFDSPEKNGPTTSHKTDLNASNMSRRSSDSSFNVEQDEEDDGASRSQSVGGPPRSASNTGAEEPSQSDSAESESKPPPPPMDSDPPEEKAAKGNDEGTVADDGKEHEDNRPAAPRMTGSAQASPTKASNRSHPNGHRSQSKDEPTDKHNNPKKGGSNNNNNKSEPKMAKYAVEDPRFAPNHAPINDTQLEGLVHRLYDPEPLRRRTLQSVEQRAQQAAAKHYNSMQDSHLAAFWFKKQQKSPSGLLSVTDETHGGGGGGRAPPAGSDPNATFPSPSRGGRHRELQPLMLRPATCPLEEDLTALCLTPRERRRYLRRKQEGGSEAAAPPRSQSMMEGGHAASSAARREQPHHHHDDNDSPEWKEQRGSAKSPQRQQGTVTRQAAAAPTPLPVVSLVIRSSEDPAIREGWLQSLLLLSVVQQEEGANKAAAGSDAGSSPRRKLYQPSSPRASEHASVTSSMKSWLNVADVKRKDLSAIWMAACPPSAYQRLVARLNLSTKQFKLGWLLQGADPPPGGTIMEIPPEAPAQDDSSCHVMISSPRSVYVLLRLGLSSEDLAPVTLNAHYCDASLKGIPPHVAEVHFAARERQRQRQLQEAVRGYADVCSQITQREFVERLQQCNPEANRHALLSREAEPVRGRPESLSGSRRRSSVDGSAADPEERGLHRPEDSANDEDEDSSQPPEDDAQAAKNRIEQSRVKQQTRQDKYLKQLARNADLMKKQTMMAQQREQLQKEKHQELLQRRQEELAERKRKQQERAEKLERIRQEAKQSELDRQQNLLKRIEEDEKRSYKLAEVRHEAHMLKQEERKIHQENKIEKVIRREKQMDYQNLLTLDRIRRKAGRAEAMQEMRHAAQKELKELRERNAVEMSQKTELFAKELLEYQRKSLQ